MRRLAWVGVALAVVVVAAVAANLVLARVVAGRISAQVADAVPGATGVSTDLDGLVAAELVRGSLDHVVVTADTVPASTGQVTLHDVRMELDGVATSTPRTAEAVRATALIPLTDLQARLGQGWKLTTDGDVLVARSDGLLGVEARVRPVVRDSRLQLDLQSVDVLGLQVSGDQVPAAVTERLNDLVGALASLPLGLSLDSVSVVPGGVSAQASGHHVTLDGAA